MTALPVTEVAPVGPAGPSRVRALGDPWPAPAVAERVARRSLWARLRRPLGDPAPVEPVATLWWPVAVMASEAAGTGRQAWVERVAGVVDLVTGRVGLADVALPEPAELHVAAVAVIAARVGPGEASDTWHDLVRDHVDRRRKPLRAPRIAERRRERAWLPLQLIRHQGRHWALDPLTGRVDPLSYYPAAEAHLASQAPSAASSSAMTDRPTRPTRHEESR